MKTILSIICFVAVISCRAQTWQWANGYGVASFNMVNNIKLTPSDFLLVSGIIGDTTVVIGNDTLVPTGLTLGYLAKFTTNGTPVWAKPRPLHEGTTFYPQFPLYISVNPDNSIYLSSQFRGFLVLGNDTLSEANGEMFVALMDSNGNYIWARNFGDVNPGGTNVVQQGRNTTDAWGNVYVNGTFNNHGYFHTDTFYRPQGTIFVAKYDRNGNEKWARQFGSWRGGEHGYDISTDAEGNVYFTGAIGDSSWFGATLLEVPYARKHLFVAKLDSSGNLLWAKQFGGINPFLGGGQIVVENYGAAIKAGYTNDVFVTGLFMDTMWCGSNYFLPNCGHAWCQNFFLLDLDRQGNFKWLKQSPVNTPQGDGLDVEADKEGNVYAAGGFKTRIGFDNLSVSSVAAVDYWDIFVAKFDTAGNCLGLVNSDTYTSVVDLTMNCENPTIFFGGDYWGDPGNLTSFGIAPSTNMNIMMGAINNNINCPVATGDNTVIDEETGLHLFPVPFVNDFYVQVSEENVLSGSRIIVRNLQGQPVSGTNTTGKITSVTTSNLAPGLYFVECVNSAGETVAAAKIIKVD